MKQQVYNPYLPLTEYVPDGEPHVFGDRVYVYGSHDEAGSTRFCVRDYTVWSAPITDLSDWTCHGVSYKKEQDPRSMVDKPVDYYAPDCVQGHDGRYYLYYSAMGPNTRAFGPMSVAVAEYPEGPFEYLHDIQYADGTPVLKFLNNDPAVLNDNGRIWLYYGWGLGRDFRSKVFSPVFNVVQSRLFSRSIEEIKKTKPSILSCAVVELKEDMYTVKAEPKAVLDSRTTALRKTDYYRHAFYEAPSIRKFGDLYYLVYSSAADHTLAYATSKYPDRDFAYRGVIISNSDLCYHGNSEEKAPGGTIHGGLECIDGKYYIFYHRLTNNTDFSRQSCAEKVQMLPDGSIPQVEVTSCGLNKGPLKGEGSYPAAICCNLSCGRKIPVGVGKGQRYPRVDEKAGKVFVRDICNNTKIGYKYFELKATVTITITYRGKAEGILNIFAGEGNSCGECKIAPAADWKKVKSSLEIVPGVYPLYFIFHGHGKFDMLEFTLS